MDKLYMYKSLRYLEQTIILEKVKGGGIDED